MLRVALPEGRAWQESVLDGPGFRLVTFLAGCPHNCPLCHNAWLCDYQAGESISETELATSLFDNYIPGWHEGVTISGGDPFVQGIELAVFLSQIKSCMPELSVWVYTGFLYEQLVKADEPALRFIDVLVDGPFISARANENQTFRGSGNQRIVFLVDGRAVAWE